MNYDPLEVLAYLEENFLESPLDKWFEGEEAPLEAPSDVLVRPFATVGQVVETARSFLDKKLPQAKMGDQPILGDEKLAMKDLTTTSFMESPGVDGGDQLRPETAAVGGREMKRTDSIISVTEADLDAADTERQDGLSRLTSRNVLRLFEDIVARCNDIFIRASTAVVRNIVVEDEAEEVGKASSGSRSGLRDASRVATAQMSRTIVYDEALSWGGEGAAKWLSCERLVVGKTAQTPSPAQASASSTSIAAPPRDDQVDDIDSVYYLRLDYSGWNLDQPPIGVFGAVLKCEDQLGDDLLEPDEDHGEVVPEKAQILDVAFFDDETSVVLLRSEGVGYLVQIAHCALDFKPLMDAKFTASVVTSQPQAAAPSFMLTREGWLARLREAVRRNRDDQTFGFASLASSARTSGHGIPGVRAHALSVCREGTGGGSVAVNGIARREVAVVLDESGRGQVLDLSRDEEEEEDDGDDDGGAEFEDVVHVRRSDGLLIG
ncbi:hypothetical protein DL93DRAFT_1965406 [Clavulina sp. PMI_390]|nr:hypothetical protein DL93DRAFT_1965406 [Clavulina sp. PMI_390]